MTVTLAIDLGGTKTLAALVAGPQVLARAEAATERSAGPAHWLGQIATMVAPWAGRWDALGITVTGLVRAGHWRAMNPGTLAIPDDWPLADRAGAMFGHRPVLANDAQAAAWGEYRHGAGQGRDMVFLTISTGIGGGVVANGRLLTGATGLAGHFGQIVTADGPRIEDLAAGRWIADQAAQTGHRAEAPAVFAAAAAGEGWAGAILDQSAARVADLCRMLHLAFDPALIVIGGGIGLAPGYLSRVGDRLSTLPTVLRPLLSPATLGADAGVIGIADLATNLPNDNRE